jgi:flagellar basal body-associated protein FliL
MAAEEKKTAEHGPAADAGKSAGGGSNKLVMILAAVNVLVTLGMAGVLFVSLQKEKAKASADDIAVADGGHGDGGHGEKSEGGHGEKSDGHGGKAGGKKKATHIGKMVTLEQFTVNLTTPGSPTPKFVRVNISVELSGDDAESEFTQKMPQVRNVIIDLFNSKRPTDLASADGRDYLKEEIRNSLNSFMVSGKIKGVYFTNFALTS